MADSFIFIVALRLNLSILVTSWPGQASCLLRVKAGDCEESPYGNLLTVHGRGSGSGRWSAENASTMLQSQPLILLFTTASDTDRM
jgi:hypothetical protein